MDMKTDPITADDLDWAAAWIENYEPTDDEGSEVAARMARVVAFLERESERLQVAEMAEAFGTSKASVRAAIRKAARA